MMRKVISPEKKAEILKFIEDFNAKHGRGGQSAAADKFKVSRVAIINWQKSVKKPGRPGRKPQAAAPAKAGRRDARELTEVITALNLLERSLPKLIKALEKLA
jgi:transposase